MSIMRIPELVIAMAYMSWLVVLIKERSKFNMINIQNNITELEYLFNQDRKYKKCYFWNSYGNSQDRGRRSREESIPEFSWDEGGHHYTAEFVVEYKYSYVKARGHYTKDGKKTNLTAIKNSYKRMTGIQNI